MRTIFLAFLYPNYSLLGCIFFMFVAFWSFLITAHFFFVSFFFHSEFTVLMRNSLFIAHEVERPKKKLGEMSWNDSVRLQLFFFDMLQIHLDVCEKHAFC